MQFIYLFSNVQPEARATERAEANQTAMLGEYAARSLPRSLRASVGRVNVPLRRQTQFVGGLIRRPSVKVLI